MLFLIDSSIYIFRGWQSLPVTTVNRFNQPDNAVQGFTESLCHILETHQPDMMVCAFDECFRQGRRNQIYPQYKADRPPAPVELAPQFARCKQVAEALGITTLGSSLVEADDIIGHFACEAQQAEQPVTIVSGDKDLVQFVSKQDYYWDLGRRSLAGYDELHKRFTVRPEQIADWLALSGDKSDNIPGVPGVGPATAARLLSKWGDLDNLLANLGDVALMRFRGAPRISRLLYEHKSSIALARSLTGMIVDENLPKGLVVCQRSQRDEQQIASSLYDIGFEVAYAGRIARRASQRTNITTHEQG